MKKITATSIFTLLLVFALKAQTITVPTFSNETVTMYAMLSDAFAKVKPYVLVTDGTINFTADIKKGEEKDNHPLGFYPQLTDIINQLKKQGYRLVTMVESQSSFKEYYFQKD